MEPQVTTYTSMSVTPAPGSVGTVAITSRVVESASSALRHLEAMDRATGVEPVHTVGRHGWRWSWEYVTADGIRCVDTVRVF